MNNLDLLIPQAPDEKNTYTWATVTQASPLRIQLDGESTPLPLTPDSLQAGNVWSVGDRVYIQIASRRMVIIGGVLTQDLHLKGVAAKNLVIDNFTNATIGGSGNTNISGGVFVGLAAAGNPAQLNIEATRAYMRSPNGADYFLIQNGSAQIAAATITLLGVGNFNPNANLTWNQTGWLNLKGSDVRFDYLTGAGFRVSKNGDYTNNIFAAEQSQAYMRNPTDSASFVLLDSSKTTVSGNMTLTGTFTQSSTTVNGFVSAAINATSSSGTAVQTSGNIVFKQSSGLQYKIRIRRLDDWLAAPDDSSQLWTPLSPSRAVPLDKDHALLASTFDAPALTAEQLAEAQPVALDHQVPSPKGAVRRAPSVTYPAGSRMASRRRVIDMSRIIYQDWTNVYYSALGDPAWKDQLIRDWIGWSAQEFERGGWPELVSHDIESGIPENLHYERVLPVVVTEFIDVINQQQDELDQLRASNNDLQARMAALESKLA